MVYLSAPHHTVTVPHMRCTTGVYIPATTPAALVLAIVQTSQRYPPRVRGRGGDKGRGEVGGRSKRGGGQGVYVCIEGERGGGQGVYACVCVCMGGGLGCGSGVVWGGA